MKPFDLMGVITSIWAFIYYTFLYKVAIVERSMDVAF